MNEGLKKLMSWYSEYSEQQILDHLDEINPGGNNKILSANIFRQVNNQNKLAILEIQKRMK